MVATKLTAGLLLVLAACTGADGGETNMIESGGADRQLNDSADQAASSPISEAELNEMLVGSDEDQNAAIERIMAEPQLVNPFTLARVTTLLMKRGDNLQAAFWYYVWQARTGPWAQANPRGGEAALRGAITNDVGSVVNGWIGGDPDVMTEVGRRALSFERRVPLYPGRPDGLTEAEWTTLVEQRRQAGQSDFDAMFPLNPQARADWDEQRRKAGLPVGPLENSGAPLPDNWR